MHIKAICCDVMRREMYAAAARSKNTVDLEFLPTGSHEDEPTGLRGRLQRALNAVDGPYDAVVLGFGLCNYGIAGLTAHNFPFIVPRAQDCIALFLGGRQAYKAQCERCPGTYFQTSGWMESAGGADAARQFGAQHRDDVELTLEEMIDKHGDVNGKIFFQALNEHIRNCRRLVYIPMAVEPDNRFEEASREEAEKNGWDFDIVPGKMDFIQRLVDGPWDPADFITVPVGSQVTMSYDDGLLSTILAGEDFR